MCQSLSLRSVDADTLAFASASRGVKRSRDEERVCVLCLDAPRTVACHPCSHLCFCAGVVTDAKDELESLVKSAGIDFHAKPFLDFVDENLLLEGFSQRARLKAIEFACDEYANMDDYIRKVVRPLRSWNMRASFMDHLATAPSAENAFVNFSACGGRELVQHFLEEAPDDWNATWKTAQLRGLKLLNSSACATPGALSIVFAPLGFQEAVRFRS